MSAELRELEAKRQKLQLELTSQSTKIEVLKQELQRHQTDLDRLKISVEQVYHNSLLVRCSLKYNKLIFRRKWLKEKRH